jgi:hypothetical protein
VTFSESYTPEDIFSLARSLGIPDSEAIILQHMARRDIQPIRDYLNRVLVRADIALAGTPLSSEDNDGNIRYTFTCTYSTLHITVSTRCRRRRLVEVIRNSQYGITEVPGFRLEEIDQLLEGRNEYNLDLRSDIIMPLMNMYEEHQSSRRQENLSRGHNFRGDLNAEEMQDTGMTKRTNPLFDAVVPKYPVIGDLGRQIEEIKSYDNIKSVKYDKKKDELLVKTKELNYRNGKIGAYQIRLSPRQKNVKLRRLPENVPDTDHELSSMGGSELHIIHPFCQRTSKKGEGDMCLGTSQSLFDDCLTNKDVFGAVNLILELLVTGTGDPYINWDIFIKALKAQEVR